jgi:alpha-mannosidase
MKTFRLAAHLMIVMLIASVIGFGQTTAQQPEVTGQASALQDMTLHVIPQSHIDIAWWWRYDPQTVNVVVRRTLEMAFENLDAFPDYTFTFLQVPAIQPLETLYPDLFYKIHYYIYHSAPVGRSIPNPHGTDPEKGRFKIAHGMWLEMDASLPSGESLVRQCIYGKRYFKYKFGLDIKSAWFQDAWTHPVTYPQILKKSGIDSYMFTRGEAGEHDERMFWWQSPDGSKVFAYKPVSRGGNMSKDRYEREMMVISRRYGVRDALALVGVGNHGGGASSKDIADWRKIMSEMTPTARFSTHTRFLEKVLAEPNRFPVYNYEMTPTIRGIYTTIGEMKRLHRESETLLLTAEKFSAIAAQMNLVAYPQKRLNAAWEKVMLNQSHDAISGTTTPPATDDAFDLYRQAINASRQSLGEAFQAIAGRVRTEGRGTPVVLFNPLSWERTDPAEVEIEFNEPVTGVDVVGPDGKAAPAQVLRRDESNGKHRLKVLFIAEGVPSLGYKTYHILPSGAGRASQSTLKASAQEIENEYFIVRIDPVTGLVAGIYDKRNRREVLDSSRRGNLIQVIEDFGDSEGFLRSADGKVETDHKWTGKTWDLDREAQIELIETGPARAVIQVKKKWELARFTSRIILNHRVPKIDFEIDIDWDGKNKMVKVAFPLAISSPEATYEIQYGNIRRPSRGEEHVAQKWVDVSDRDYGVSLLNDSRYGYDVKNNVIRLSLLRSPVSPAYLTDEIGVHTIRYSLSPHRSGWQDGDTVRRGYELNYPLFAHLTDSHAGELPPTHSFLSVEAENVIVEALKKAEDSDDLILRLYESEGRKTDTRVNWSQPVDTVHAVDMLENASKEVAILGRGMQISVGAYSIESYKLIRDKK